jgi:hypothetical protein
LNPLSLLLCNISFREPFLFLIFRALDHLLQMLGLRHMTLIVMFDHGLLLHVFLVATVTVALPQNLELMLFRCDVIETFTCD